MTRRGWRQRNAAPRQAKTPDGSMTTQKLFAVYLGGRAPKGNTELHDVVFVTGNAIEDTYEQCLDKWFGTPTGLHLDSWIALEVVDGYRIALRDTKPATGDKLYFVNLGAYRDGEFTEIHANKFLVAASAVDAKLRAKRELLQNWPSAVHTDDLYEIDTCMEIGTVNALHVVLTKTGEAHDLTPNNGYHIVPKVIVADYIQRKGLGETPGLREAYSSD
jgi:hypothetical protein